MIQNRRERDRYELFINNELVPASDGGTFESINPAIGQPFAEISSATASDIDTAVAGAHEACAGWWRTDARRRAGALYRLGELIERNSKHLAEIETTDNGRPIRETYAQAGLYSQWYKYFAGLADKVQGRTIPVGTQYLNYTLRVPYGVVGAITPWNHPLLIASKKLAPALAAGNAVVVKPSELAPCSVLEVAALARDAGFPPGALQVVTGGGEAGAAVAAQKRIARVDVTGSTKTGIAVATAAGKSLKQFAGELGGKTPVLVFDDVDIDVAARGVQFAGFIGSGQTCIAGSRILVQDTIFDEFLSALVERVKRMHVGMPRDHATDMGPQISSKARERIEGFVQSAIHEGAEVLVGGGRPDDPALQDGFFMEPTIIVHATNQMTCAREEIFGPVLVVMPFQTEADGIAMANDTPFGLGAAVWTRDVARAHRVARDLVSGTIWVNMHHRNDPGSPWGGFGASGFGRENGLLAMANYTTTKSVWLDLDGKPVTWYDHLGEERLN